MDPGLLTGSLAVALIATATGLLLGLPVAVAMQAKGRAWWIAGSVLVLALPTFFVAGMWMERVGFAGAWRIGSGPWTNRILPVLCSGTVLGLWLWPITALLLAGAWDGVDRRIFDAHPDLRGTEAVRHVLWPAARGALWQPALITAVLAFGQFTVPALFQARVWPAEVWIEFSTRFDVKSALARSWLPALGAAALAAFALRGRVRWPSSDRGGAAPPLGRGIAGASILMGACVLAVALGYPLLAGVFNMRTWTELGSAAAAAGPAVARSALYAAASATAITATGALLAAWRWPAVLVVSLVLPGILVGIFVSMAVARPGWDALRGSPLIVILAFTARYAFVGWYAAARARESANAGLSAVARISGAGRWAHWRHVVWPTGSGMLLGGWYVSYLLCLWDVETLILVVPPGGESLSLMIFNLLHYGHNAQVNALCLMLAVLALLPLGAVMALRRITGRGSGVLRPRAIAAGMPAALALAVAGCGPGVPPGSVEVNSRIFERVEVIGGRGTGPGFFVKPRSVAVDGAGYLYVVDMTARVQKFTPDGAWVLLWQMEETERGRPKGMATAPDGGILVVEPHYHRVNHFSTDGTLVRAWGTHGMAPGELWFPRSIAVTPGGDCFVSEYGRVERVQRLRLDDGSLVAVIGREGEGPGEFNRVEGLDVDASGRLYVADSCNHRVQVFDRDGSFLRAHGRAGQGPGEMSYPYDVRVDPAGFQYVCEFGNSRVQVFDAEDRPVEVLGGPGTEPGRMHNPWSICLNARGDLYVADSQNHRVLKFVRREPLGGSRG